MSITGDKLLGSCVRLDVCWVCSSIDRTLPFELRALEAALAHTCRSLEQESIQVERATLPSLKALMQKVTCPPSLAVSQNLIGATGSNERGGYDTDCTGISSYKLYIAAVPLVSNPALDQGRKLRTGNCQQLSCIKKGAVSVACSPCATSS